MKKVMIIIAALLAVFVGLGAILPALAQVRDIGAMPKASVGSYTLGVFLVSVAGAGAVFCAFSKRRSR